MKQYKITVNGKTYEVEVEEIGGQNYVSQEATQTAKAPERPVESPKPQQQKTKKSGTTGKEKITSPMPGTIMSIKVKPGDNVQKGNVIMILEAMKMENEIIAPEDGVITSIDVDEGASVNTGDILATFE